VATANEQAANAVMNTIQDLIAVMVRSFRRSLLSGRETLFLG
jgi:hypothetical protein